METWWLFWPISIVYLWLNNLVFKGPFGLMLHCTSHRPWFKKEYKGWNNMLPWFVGPFFGQTPETYFSHHIGMHHPENNLEDDLSTTMHHQRDSFWSFMHYFLDFLLVGIFRVQAYFKRKKLRKLWMMLVRGEILYILFCVGLAFVNWPATFVVFVLPYLISRFVMMLGNFTQHTFVDASDAGNPYKNSITCVNVKYNHKCWNDGYHIGHHNNPSMHYTDYPKDFQKNLDKYAQNQAIVFQGVDYLKIWFWVMTRNYDKLADNMVNINNAFPGGKEEAIRVMKERTQRIPRNAPAVA